MLNTCNEWRIKEYLWLITLVGLLYIFMSVNVYGAINLEGALEDVSNPDHVIGTGTPESCTEEAFIQAVAEGGVIVFDGGTKPFTLELSRTAKVFNDGKPDVVIDGGGLVTLSGGDKTRILYMNTCDQAQSWSTSHCQNQDHPRLTVQNISFANGNATGEEAYTGGGAIWVRGGRFKALNCTFTNNVAYDIGPDVGGGALRVFSQHDDMPVYLINCTFGGGPGLGNVAANGGAISSIGVSWTILNSVFTYNEAIGNGGNPAKFGTPGGGSGGAIYNDGNTMTLRVVNSHIENNQVTTHGSGIFFVTNNHKGNIELERTSIKNNLGGSWYPVLEGISMHSDTRLDIIGGRAQNEIVPTTATLSVADRDLPLVAYNIKGNNYYKLRDLALALNGTEASISVEWNGVEEKIVVTKGESYEVVGNEHSQAINAGIIRGEETQAKLIYNGLLMSLKAYNIKGNNYFKLRELCELIDIEVNWSEAEQKIYLDPSKSYVN